MGLSTLRQLADDGLSSAATDLPEHAVWCRSWCLETGDARYCILGEMLHAVDAWWREHDELGGIPAELAETLDRLIKHDLPSVLDAESATAGAGRAERLRLKVVELLTGPENWR
jgi:hypothetical protein